MAPEAPPIVPVTGGVAPGVRLHLLPTDRFATAVCRVVLHRGLDEGATATSLLALVLQSATERHPTRQALAHALADLYGAGLHVAVGKVGARQLLTATLEWPTAALAGGRRQLGRGLALLRDVLSRPRRSRRGGAALDAEHVATQQRNLDRMLASLDDDTVRRAARRCLALAGPGEVAAREAFGRREAIEGLTPARLGAHHARLLATAPVDVFLVADLDWPRACAAIVRHLLWPGRGRLARPPAAVAVRPARGRPRRRVEHDAVAESQLAWAWRAPLKPRSALFPAAALLAGVLGGGSFGRLFQVVREEHGLCYDAEARWLAAQGLLLIGLGVEPGSEARAGRVVHRLVRDAAAGHLEASAVEGVRAAVRAQGAALGDDRAAWLAWMQVRTTLGLDPDPTAWRHAIERVRPAQVRRVGQRLGLEASYALRPGTASRGRP